MGNGESRGMRQPTRPSGHSTGGAAPRRPTRNNPPLNISPNQGANSQAGAYKMPGQAKNNRYFVTIPRGVSPGQHFAVLVNGTQMMVKCPESSRPGERLVVTAPRNQSQQYVVMVGFIIAIIGNTIIIPSLLYLILPSFFNLQMLYFPLP